MAACQERVICFPCFSYRTVGLVDAHEEDEFGEEDGGYQVLVDAVQIGVQPPQYGQQEEGDEEGHQRGGHRGVGHDLQGQHISMLTHHRITQRSRVKTLDIKIAALD